MDHSQQRPGADAGTPQYSEGKGEHSLFIFFKVILPMDIKNDLLLLTVLFKRYFLLVLYHLYSINYLAEIFTFLCFSKANYLSVVYNLNFDVLTKYFISSLINYIFFSDTDCRFIEPAWT